MSLVLEIQALAQSSETDVVELVRRAQVVAAKLKLVDVSKWLESELNGYRDEEVPQYRRLPTDLVSHNPFHGTRSVQWGAADALYDHFQTMKNGQPIGQIAALLKGRAPGKTGPFTVLLSPEEVNLILDSNGRRATSVSFSRRVDHSSLAGVLDGVRNRILRWSLDLESEGILGEGMTFSSKERAVAHASSVVNNYGLMVQGNNASAAQAQHSPGASVSATQQQTANQLDALLPALANVSSEVSEGLRSLSAAIEQDRILTAAQKSEAIEHVAAVAQQVLVPPSQRTPSVVRLLAAKARDGLSLTADVLQVWVTVVPFVAKALGFPLS